MSSAKATGYLELNLTGFDQAIGTAKKALVGLAAAFVTFKTAKYFTDGIADAIKFGKEMQVASNKMGKFDPGTMLIVQKALQNAGLGAEEARGAMSDFVDSGRDISTIFGGVANYAEALKNAAADSGEQAGVLTRSAKALQTVWNTVESIGSKTRTFFLTMTEQFVKPLQVVLEYINTIDLSGIGTSFGSGIAQGANILIGLLKNGDLWKVMGTGIQWAFWSGISVLQSGLKQAIAFLSGAFNSIIKSFQTNLFSNDVIAVIKRVFRGVGDMIASALLKATSMALGAMGFGFQGKSERVGRQADVYGKNASDAFESAGRVMEGIDFGKVAGDIGDALKAGMEAMKKAAEDGESPSEKKARESWEKMADTIKAAIVTGEDMGNNSGKINKPPDILNQLSGGGGAHVIADSLAKVGGGGNYLQVGMSLAERAALRTARASEQTAKACEALEQQGKKDPKTKPVLGR